MSANGQLRMWQQSVSWAVVVAHWIMDQEVPGQVWFPLGAGLFLLFFSLLFPAISGASLKKVPRGSATYFQQKLRLSCAVWDEASLIYTEWAKKVYLYKVARCAGIAVNWHHFPNPLWSFWGPSFQPVDNNCENKLGRFQNDTFDSNPQLMSPTPS